MITISNDYQTLKIGNILSFAIKKTEETQLRLATGLRINSAKDDPAGLSVAVKLDAQIRGCEVAKLNSQYAQSTVETVASAVGMINDKYAAIKDLAIKAQGAAGNEEKALYAEEAKQIYDSIFQIQATVMNQFGAPSDLTAAKNSTTTFQIGANADATSKLDVNLFKWVMPNTTIAPGDFDFSSDANIQAVISKSDAAMKDTLTPQQGYLGAMSNILEDNANFQSVYITNLTASRSRIMDADLAKEAGNLAKYEIMVQSAAALLSQSQSLNASVALNLILNVTKVF